MSKHVVILGAGSDIAAAVAARLHQRGDRLTLVSRRLETAQALSRHLWALRGPAPAALELRGFAAALDEPVDSALVAFGDLAADGIAQAMDANFHAVVRAIQELTPRMRRGGTLAVITSVAGERPRIATGAYGLAKAATIHYLSLLRQSAPPFHVCDIRPGPTRTRMTSHLDGRGALWSAVDDVAAGIERVLDRPRPVTRLPARWNLIMPVVRLLPERMLARLQAGRPLATTTVSGDATRLPQSP